MARARPAALAALLLVLGHQTAASQTPAAGDPLSAIDWLSDSVALPAPAAPSTPTPQPPATAAVPEVTVAPLDAPVPDRAGLINARDLGLRADIWGGSAASDLARLVAATPPIGLPSLRRFHVELLAARLDPPIDAVADDSLYLARIDKLLDLGQLPTAEALIAAGGAPEPRRFRRQFDIALLNGTETQACKVIETTPDISPTFPARIFCLARNGEFDVAALTLGTAEALGILADEEERLLLHFLDPDLFEGDPLPPLPEHVSPLVFRLYEAVGERPATDSLPIAFAVADLAERIGWRDRLRAAERLAAAGALPAERLMAVYGERKPAASGGVWDRVAAMQALASALDTGRGIAGALPSAWEAAVETGAEGVLAPWIAQRLGDVTLPREARHAAFEIALLADDLALSRRTAGTTAEDLTLLAVAEGRPQDIQGVVPLDQAIRRSLSGLAPGGTYRYLMGENRVGEALLEALDVLSDGAEGDPAALGDALALLRALGLGDLARRVAVELLLEASRA